MARTALRAVPEFGLVALGLPPSGKNLPLTLVLGFFLLLVFPRRLPWVYNDCISLQHDSCSFTSSRVNLKSGQAKMLNLFFLLPVVLWPPPSFPVSTACIAIT